MTQRLPKLLLILGLVIALIAGFLLFNRHSPFLYYTSHPANYEECVKAGGTLTHDRGVNACVFKTGVFIEHKVKTLDENALKKFTDTEYGYELAYPGKNFAETDTSPSVMFLEGKFYDSTTLVHSIDVEHCDLSGRPEGCTPQTTDISITLTPINKPYSEVVAAALKFFGSLDDAKWGSTAAKSFMAGAEGEGVYYYFIELPNNKTVLISRTYINEEVVGQYKEAKDFIKYADQEKIFNQIMQSFKLTKN